LSNRSGPGRLSGRPQSIATIRTAVEPLVLLCDSAWRRIAASLPPLSGYSGNSRGFRLKSPFFVRPGRASPVEDRRERLLSPARALKNAATLFEFHLRPGLFELGLDLLRLVLGN